MNGRVVAAGPWETVVDNLHIARRVARNLYWLFNRAMSYDDLYQYATIGLYEAVIKHRPGPGRFFPAFAYRVARNRTLDALWADSWWSRWTPGMGQERHSVPFSIDYMRYLFDQFDVADDSDDTAHIDGEHAARDLLARLVPLLDERESEVLVELVINERTPKEIAPLLGVTPGRVSQIRQHIIAKVQTLGTYSVRDPSRECPKGHPLTGDKARVYAQRGGSVSCAICVAVRQRERQMLRKGTAA